MKKKKTKAPVIFLAEVPPAVGSDASKRLSKRPTIAELEAILNEEGDTCIAILPNGEVRAVTPEEMAARPKPLTMREDLGGEYGARLIA